MHETAVLCKRLVKASDNKYILIITFKNFLFFYCRLIAFLLEWTDQFAFFAEFPEHR